MWVALVASTITTVAIFLPVIYMDGIEGQIFGDLAFTVTVSVIVSFSYLSRFYQS
ncbi:efflux RND transporter permease subunit [Pseudoalteromonas piscicida]|uniref:efflux RND transporter permease subunit n=1 Tax=Pseudoalteromonas piscicida TaxID=43662 RepID=UPI000E35F479|nr:efflux RND transporter permease subunit [Pseudoalteromonas piscicida]